MNKELEMTPNVLVEFLQKPASEFTKEDIIRYIYEKDIQMVNFMYPAGDGRLKTLNFVINNAAYLDAILTCGERVDGSRLSRREVVTCMWCPVSVRLSRIRLRNYLRLPCFAHSSIRMENP